jgi:hypothetical protein
MIWIMAKPGWLAEASAVFGLIRANAMSERANSRGSAPTAKPAPSPPAVSGGK